MGLNYGFQGKKIRPSNLINHFISLFNKGEDSISFSLANSATTPKDACAFWIHAYHLPH